VSRPAKHMDPPPVAELPPEVLVVARATTQAGAQCVAALYVRGRKLTRAVVLEECQEGQTADRSWREWAWRLLRCGEAVPEAAPSALRTARGLALARAGKVWGAVLVALDAEGMDHTAVGEGATKIEAWDELDRYAALHLLDDERRARLKGRTR
jgi:hypothetical protein